MARARNRNRRRAGALAPLGGGLASRLIPVHGVTNSVKSDELWALDATVVGLKAALAGVQQWRFKTLRLTWVSASNAGGSVAFSVVPTEWTTMDFQTLAGSGATVVAVSGKASTPTFGVNYIGSEWNKPADSDVGVAMAFSHDHKVSVGCVEFHGIVEVRGVA